MSELTTNAVIHARSAPVLVASFADRRLRIEVHDRDGTPPHVRDDAGESGGWGLRLVDTLADGWGWSPTRLGKQVWAEFRHPR